MVCGVLLLLLLLKMLGMSMNDRWWRMGCRCFGSKVDCRSVDVNGYGHVSEVDLGVEA